MAVSRTDCRADVFTVTDVLSEAYSRTIPCKADTPFERIDSERANSMGFPTAWLQEVEWEMYNGTHGPFTVLKAVEHGTMTCPECGTEARYDDHGDAVCDDETCGVVVSGRPLVVPEDSFNGRTSGTGKAALNDQALPAENDPL